MVDIYRDKNVCCVCEKEKTYSGLFRCAKCTKIFCHECNNNSDIALCLECYDPDDIKICFKCKKRI